MNQIGKGVYGEVTRAEHMCLARNRSWLTLTSVEAVMCHRLPQPKGSPRMSWP